MVMKDMPVQLHRAKAPAQIKKFFEMTHGAHRVRVLKCSGAEKGNIFLKRVNMDIDLAIDGEVADDVCCRSCSCDEAWCRSSRGLIGAGDVAVLLGVR